MKVCQKLPTSPRYRKCYPKSYSCSICLILANIYEHPWTMPGTPSGTPVSTPTTHGKAGSGSTPGTGSSAVPTKKKFFKSGI